jgi:hypothetical protein
VLYYSSSKLYIAIRGATTIDLEFKKVSDGTTYVIPADQASTFHHYTVVLSSRKVELWVDAVLVAHVTSTSKSNIDCTSTNKTLRISGSTSSNDIVNSEIDDFRIYNKVLNFDEIEAIYSGKETWSSGSINVYSTTQAQITPFSALLFDKTRKVAVKVRTTEDVLLDVSDTTKPFITLLYNWSNTENNYMDIVMSDKPTSRAGAKICLGKCLYNGSNQFI